MKYTLRPYQQEAVDAAMAHIRSTISSCVIILPTGAGKSMVVAELAARIYEMSKKRVLCIAPTGELVTQNRSKYLLTGEPASMFSAKAGPKNLRHPVVFGSPVTIKNSIEMFGDKYGAVIIDECDGITPTIKFIINEIRRRNPKLRTIGMTATPYRLGTGYIYKEHYIDGPTDEETAIEPYYDKVVYELEAKFLIDNGNHDVFHGVLSII
jgi:DNA repair protein RadD